MFYRGYDPTIGRMLQVDPYATMYSSVSTYNYAMNNPVLLNDPTGGYIYANAAADRLAKINNPDLYTQQWAEDFDSYLASLPPSGGGGGFSTSNPVAIAIILQAARSGISGGDLVSFVSGQTTFHMEIGGINYGFNFTINQDGYSLFAHQVTEGKEGGWASENDLIFVAGDNFSSPGSFGAQQAVPGDPKCPTCLDPSTVGNWFYTYGGPNNPLSNNGNFNYDLPPQNISDQKALTHDKNYDKKGAVGGLSLVVNFSVIKDDMRFVRHQLNITGAYITQFTPISTAGFIYAPSIDPVTNQPLSAGTAANAFIQGVGLGIITAPKILIEGFLTHGPFK
jgi:hypothetical protein